MPLSDDKNVGEMLVACTPALRAFIRRRVKDPEIAGDVLQEVSVRALAAEGPPDVDSYLSWSCGIARHVIGAEWRRRHRERTDPELYEPLVDQLRDPLASPDQRFDAQTQLRHLFNGDAIGVALLARRYFDEVSGKDLAAEMGLTPAALRMRLMRTRSAVRARSEQL